MNNYIELEHVSKCFRGEPVVTDVNLSLEEGNVYGFIGNNGSGKTVLMKCICGFYRPDGGTIRVGGEEIGVDTDFPKDTGIIIETPGFLPGLSGVKNLKILASIQKRAGGKEIAETLRMVGLSPDLKKPVSKYSLGMRQRLGIAQAILEDPRLLILDEPFNGLDRHGVEDIRSLLLSWKERGKTIILASHNDEDIRILCDRVYLVDGGRVRIK